VIERQHSFAVDANDGPVRLASHFRLEDIRAEFVLNDEIEAQLFVGNRQVFKKLMVEPRGKSYAVFPPKLTRTIHIPAGVPVELRAKGGRLRFWLNGFRIEPEKV
jgi:hypothetical protein